jgi:hypothetical protein
MTQEEKAKAYDEALERAKKWFNPEEPDSWTCIVESIFPELHKSEDEEKPNGGIVLEDFNEGDCFYKLNLPYLSKEQVEEIENIVKKWNTKIKESEDDRVRKLLIDYLKERRSCYFKERKSCGHQYLLRYDHWINWLEKQGEQNPTWSEYDELMLKDVLEFIETGWSGNGKSHLVYWLKSIKDKIIEYNKK